MVNAMLQSIQSIFSTFVGDIIVAVIILFIGFAVGKIVGRVVNKFLKRLELDKVLKQVAGIKFSLENILSLGAAYFVYFISVIMALGKLGIATTVLQIISAGAITLVVLAILLGIKDFIPNLVAGLFISQKQLFKEGNNIKFQEIEGKVVSITLLETQLKTKTGDIIHIPNSNLTKNKIIVKKN